MPVILEDVIYMIILNCIILHNFSKLQRFIPRVDFELDPSLPFQKTIFTVYKKIISF